MASDTWQTVAMPIMESIAERERGGERARASFADVIEDTSLPSDVVERELRALIHGVYVGGIEASSLAGFDYISLHLHEKGKAAIGEWPGGDAFAALVKLIDDRIESEPDPEKKRRFSTFRSALTDLGTGTGGSLLADFIRGLLAG